MKSCTLAASLLLLAGGLPACLAGTAAPATNARPLFPAPQTSGVVPITVSCTGTVTGKQTVAFGLPLPRGFLADAANLRLESPEGGEIAADVTELARWRHFSDAAIDGRSVRSVLIAFDHDCQAGAAAHYQVHWGVARTLAAHTGITPHNVYTTWGPQAHAVHGEHPRTDDYAVDTAAAPLSEPKAWVTLPAPWLMSVNLRGPMSAPTSTRLKADALGYAATYVNDVASDVTADEVKDDGHGLINWTTEVEGWLYDRPFALWGVYLQTGDLKWLRRAHRASQYYASWVAVDNSHAPYRRGAFMKKPPDYAGDGGDAKYSLAGGLYADYLLTGDARLLDRIRAIAEFLGAQVSTRLFKADRTNGLWTERHLGAAIAGALYAYEATGDAVFKARVTQIIAGMQADVSSPPAGYPSAAQMQGVLLHRPEVHEGDGYADWIMSPWMSALLCESLWHYYLLSDDRVALQFIGDYAEFVTEKGLYRDSTDAHLSAYWAPWYIAGLQQGHTDNGINDDVEHAPDVLGLLARGRYARTLLGQPTAQIERQIANLRATRDFALGNWLRDSPGLPRYRLAPTRKFAWWYGTTYDLGWLGVSD